MSPVRHEELVITDRGEGHPARVPAANVKWSREIGAAGSLSCYALVSDLRRAGLGDDLVGRWVTYDSAAGRWSGVITGRPVTNGIAEIVADGAAALLRGRVLVEQDRPAPGSPGGLMRRAVIAAAREEPTFVELGTIDEGGAPIGMAIGSGDVLDDILPSIAEAGEVEWLVDANRRFHAARRLGVDRSHAVRLVEDRHIVAYRSEDDLWSARAGQRIVIESAESFAQRAAQAIASATPRPARVSNPLPGGRSEAMQARSALNRLGPGMMQFLIDAPPRVFGEPLALRGWVSITEVTTPLELNLVNADDCWRAFDLGDTVWVDLGSAGFTGTFRAKSIGLDAASAVLTVAGDALIGGGG